MKIKSKITSKGILKAAIGIISVILVFILLIINQKTDKSIIIEDDFVKIIDVGNADSILIYSNGYSALIDVGLSASAGEISACLEELDIKNIDVLIFSHLHNDHTGGIEKLLTKYSVSKLILPEISVESEGLGDAELAINTVTRSGGEVFNAKQGMNFEIGDFEITVLAAFNQLDGENNRSVITSANLNGIKFLFMGDAESAAEKLLLKEGLDLKSDVIKIGHHGSGGSSSDELLKAARPRYAAISVGEGNSYGHPHNETLARLQYINAEVLRTDYDGDITFIVKDNKLSVKTEK